MCWIGQIDHQVPVRCAFGLAHCWVDFRILENGT